MPWLDYSGRLSSLKLLVFLSLFVPGIWVAYAYQADALGARPLNEAIHQIGLWAIRFMFLALAITPARQILQWSRLILVRRMLGVAAFAYAAIHLALYATDQGFDLVKVATEIVARIYLTIGFVALLGLTALAATSTDGMIRRLGKRWQQLHRIVYGIGVLASIHFFLQAKLEIWEPTMMAGLFIWLLGYRAMMPVLGVRGRLSPRWIGILSLGAGAATALGEALYYWAMNGIDPLRVLDADLTLDAGLRPAWVVVLVGAAITAAAVVRTYLAPRPKQRLKPA